VASKYETITGDEYALMVAKAMPEKALQAKVIDLATRAGWLVYHTYDSRRSEPGFPDLVLVHPTRGVLWRELKKHTGKPTADQRKWLERLELAGEDVGIWRPMDWLTYRVHKELGIAVAMA